MKTLTITNGTDSYEILCTKKINTMVSEECMSQFTYKDNINPKEVVLTVLLKECNIDQKEINDWGIIDN
jgi:hypothetical protein